MLFKALQSFHTGLLIHAAQSRKTKYSNGEREMLSKKINNHYTMCTRIVRSLTLCDHGSDCNCRPAHPLINQGTLNLT